MDKKGFTLIELLVVLGILTILASIAVPLYIGYERGAARQEATTNLQGLSLCLEQYYAENAQYTPALNTTYIWNTTSSGSVNTHTLTDWLTSFNPKKAAGTVNNYEYTVSAATISTYAATAIPLYGPVKGDGNLTLDNNGNKTGKW